MAPAGQVVSPVFVAPLCPIEGHLEIAAGGEPPWRRTDQRSAKLIDRLAAVGMESIGSRRDNEGRVAEDDIESPRFERLEEIGHPPVDRRQAVQTHVELREVDGSRVAVNGRDSTSPGLPQEGQNSAAGTQIQQTPTARPERQSRQGARGSGDAHDLAPAGTVLRRPVRRQHQSLIGDQLHGGVDLLALHRHKSATNPIG